MSSILALFSWIFFGDFGLLTLTPRYLFGVLFPVMVFVGFLSRLLQRRPGICRLPLVIGLGCTTAAVTAADSIKADSLRQGILWLLILLIPCSSQIAIIASFAAIVRLRVFLVYLAFTAVLGGLLFLFLHKLFPIGSDRTGARGGGADEGTSGSEQAGDAEGVGAWGPQGRQVPAAAVAGAAGRGRPSIWRLKPWPIIKEAFLSVVSTIPSFCIGSVLISALTYFGIMEILCDVFAPWLEVGLHLPKEAASLFVLNLFKRDFGSASLLAFAEAGAFDAAELVIVMIMLTFCVPCFNTTVLLYKQEKLPKATLLWLGSLCVCLFFGRLVSAILFVCTF